MEEQTNLETTLKHRGRPRGSSNKTNSKNEKKESLADTVYLAVDSDFLRALALYTVAKTTEEEKIKTSNRIADNIDQLRYFKSLMDNDAVKIIVTSTVYHECAKAPFCEEFIKKSCIIPQIDSKNFRKYAVETSKLANAYCFEEIDVNGNKVTAMHPQYSAVIGEPVPTNDSFIMAEATVLGLCLITLNQKDFIQRASIYIKAKKGQIDEYNDIVQGITTINKKYGYLFESTKFNLYTSPRPFSPTNFMDINKGSLNLGKFICPKPLIQEDGSFLEKDN